MYIDSKSNRILFEDGRSLFDDDEYIKRMFNGSLHDTDCVLYSPDTESYSIKYKECISMDDAMDGLETEKRHDNGITILQRDALLERLQNSHRFNNPSEEEDNRLLEELEFFDRTNNLLFLYKLMQLIDRFKEDGVVWGVGRGSSVASYVLYLLEVHDINPVKYDIDFAEMSKESIE